MATLGFHIVFLLPPDWSIDQSQVLQQSFKRDFQLAKPVRGRNMYKREPAACRIHIYHTN